MPDRNIPFSFRIRDKDAEFLARLDIEGANTPSDKIRAIIAAARRQDEGQHDYATALQHANNLLAAPIRAIREAENQQGVQSQILARVAQWLPDALAVYWANSPESPDDKKALELLERDMSERLFVLFESILQLGVTDWSHCHNPTQVEQRAQAVLKLANVLLQLRESETKQIPSKQ